MIFIPKVTDGPIQVGTVFHTLEQPSSNLLLFKAKVMFPMMKMMLGIKDYTEAEITALEPERRVAWKAGAPIRKGYMIKSAWELLLEPAADGTKVTQRFHFSPQIAMAKMVSNDSQAEDIAEEVDNNLKTLKTHMENQQEKVSISDF